MKKTVAFCLALTMMMGAILCASADSTSAVPSPSGENGPKVIAAKVDDTDCAGDIVVTPYANRETASNDVRQGLEAAYANVQSADSVVSLNTGLTELAKSLDLAVSDLFDLRDTDTARQGKQVKITLSSDTFKGFAALMYYDSGAWQLVDGATVTQVGDDYHLAFTSLGAYPYAVVVGTPAENPTKPQSILYGDANGDGKVNMKDVLVLRKYMADYPVTIVFINSDVDVDNKANMKDVLLIRKYLAELIDHLGPTT